MLESVLRSWQAKHTLALTQGCSSSSLSVSTALAID
jgi:hypothetical protein